MDLIKKPADVKTQIKTIALELGVAPEIVEGLAEKCYDEVYWRPFGGATSFDEIDKAEATREYSWKVDDETYKLRAIIENITNVDELDVNQKTTAIQTAASEYRSRISALQVEPSTGLMEKIKNFILGHSSEIVKEVEADIIPTIGSIKVFKDKNGNNRWFSWSSNAFEDLEKELFTTKALEEAVEHADETGERGPLLVFHVPGTEIGQCDYQAIAGRFLLESGTFLDTPLGNKAVEYFENTEEEHQVSIGYEYHDGDEADGQYDWLRIKERSICPVGHAANPWTDFRLIGGKEMEERKVAALTAIFGEELANSVIAKADDKTKELEGSGTRFKEGEDPAKKEEEKPAADDKPAEVKSEEIPSEDKAKKKPMDGEDEDDEEKGKKKEAVIGGDQLTQLATLLADISAQVESLAQLPTTVAEIQDEVKALKKTDDERLANMINPRWNGFPGAIRPTESNANLIDGKAVEEVQGEENKPNPNPVAVYVEDLLRAPTRI